jgi:integrase
LIRNWQHKLGEHVPKDLRVPTETELQRAATTLGYVRTDLSIAEWWAEAKSNQTGAHRRFIESLEQRRQRYLEQRETGMLEFWRCVANHLLEKNSWHLPCTQTYDRFVQLSAEAIIDRLRVEIEIRNGNFAAEPTSKVVRAGLTCSAQPDESILRLFSRYSAQRLAEKRKRADTLRQDEIVLRHFAGFIGDDRSVRTIERAEVRDWRDTLAALPPGFSSSKAYSGLSLRDAAAKARSVGASKRSLVTVNKYLSTVSPFLSWCVRNGFADRNPCDGLFYDLPKGSNPRPPFSAAQLEILFASPLFTGCECDGREHIPGRHKVRDWRFWIPLICFFTGARISEVAQLKVGDIGESDGVPFIYIRHNEAEGQTTKSGRSRIAPIHPKLVELGFFDLAAQREAGEALFPQLRRNSRGNIGATASRFWRKYLTKLGLKTKGLGSHSFRHLLADRLREAGYINEEIRVILGHTQKSVTSGYGLLPEGTVLRLSEMIEKLSFIEVDGLIKNNSNKHTASG